jgi:ABC-type Fe3+ transport system permease subunit
MVTNVSQRFGHMVYPVCAFALVASLLMAGHAHADGWDDQGWDFPIITNAYVAVDGVQTDAVEAARGMGMTDRQIIIRVELPLALPLIFAGIRTATVFVVATATIAAVAGGGGLGDIIVNQASYFLKGVVAASIAVAALAFAANFAFALLQRIVTPRSSRSVKTCTILGRLPRRPTKRMSRDSAACSASASPRWPRVTTTA